MFAQNQFWKLQPNRLVSLSPEQGKLITRYPLKAVWIVIAAKCVLTKMEGPVRRIISTAAWAVATAASAAAVVAIATAIARLYLSSVALGTVFLGRVSAPEVTEVSPLVLKFFSSLCCIIVSWTKGFRKIHFRFPLFCKNQQQISLQRVIRNIHKQIIRIHINHTYMNSIFTFSSSSCSFSSLLLLLLFSLSLVGDLKAFFTAFNHEFPPFFPMKNACL